MRREGQGRRLAAELARPHQGCADHGTMPAMYAIEVADRHHCTPQRSAVDTFRTAAYNMELSYRRTRSAHCVSGRLEEIVVENVRILSLIGRTFLTAATLSAPITNLQINGLFKARCYFWAPLWGGRRGAHARWLSIRASTRTLKNKINAEFGEEQIPAPAARALPP